MVTQMSRDVLADEAAVAARAMGTPELRGWRERLTVDLIEPGYAAEDDAAVAVIVAQSYRDEVDRELTRRVRAARMNQGITSPTDRQYGAMLELAAALKERVTVVDYLAVIGWELRRVGRDGKGREEYAGPCPLCGGRDRFRCWGHPESRYWCRGCGASGDVVQLLRQVDGLDFGGAVRELAVMVGVRT